MVMCLSTKRGDEKISYLVGIVTLVNYGAFPLVAVIESYKKLPNKEDEV